MYCSEKCRSSDWKSSGHKGVCNKLFSPPKTLEPFKHEEFIIPAPESRFSAMKSLIVRLITCIGLDTIKKAVLENNPLKSFEDPRTKGFQGGQFGTATLEALLSLEDQFGKWSSEELNAACKVSS
jgi:hypothetical protein